MAIALNAGSNPNGQTPSIGAYGDGNGTENSLLGNFGDLLTLISADAENAVHEKNSTPQMTAKQTSEALLEFAKNGNEDAKIVVSNILQKVATENKNQPQPNVGGGIQTSYFLETKIENKLQQLDLFKPYKVIELLSLADLIAFGKNFDSINVDIPVEELISEKYETIATTVPVSTESLLDEDYLNNNPVVSKGPGLIGNGVVSAPSALIGNDVISAPSELLGSTTVINTSDLFSNDKNILTPLLSNSAAVKPNANDATEVKSIISQINNPNPSTKPLLTEKDQLTLDVVKNILQVDSASLVIGETGPSEAIFDLRDLKEAIVQ